MSAIEQVVPVAGRVDLDPLVDRLAATRPSAPFSDDVMKLCAAYSQQIFHDAEAKRYPELPALAFWMRKTELTRMRGEFERLASADTLLTPRGVVFHVPPANVDTIFIYSWLLSALTGNVNVIRLSERSAPQVEVLCRLFREALANGPASVRDKTVMVRYGHQEDITAAFSRIADVRVIWGGDATVGQIRRIPLPVHARELTFPDRRSLSVLNADRYMELSEEEAARLAERFFNDAFWFDQMGCSSPRMVVWCGPEDASAAAASKFFERLAREVARKGYHLPDAARLARFTFACRAILEASVSGCVDRPELMVLDLSATDRMPLDHCGGGLFFQTRINALGDLVGFLEQRDQTLTHFGFEAGELRALALTLSGRAIDRMVPIGQALQFNRFWDGYDLLREFTRSVHIQNGQDGSPR